MRKPISSYSPFFYSVSVFVRRAVRRASWYFGARKFAKVKSSERLPFRVYKHQSVLIRKLGDVDLRLQYNKVTNIRLAIEKLSGIVIRPGETFSFAYLTGEPTRKKGYLNGVLLRNGEAVEGVGGGICQIANLIHWLSLHSPLTVTEHHHHGFDPFPDSGRVVPFGTGATLFYNYLDYQLYNGTPYDFQLIFWLDDKCLNGDLRVSQALPYVYHVFEKNHSFIKEGERYYRTNEIWRNKIKKIGSGDILETELIQKNHSLVKYVPECCECTGSTE